MSIAATLNKISANIHPATSFNKIPPKIKLTLMANNITSKENKIKSKFGLRIKIKKAKRKRKKEKSKIFIIF